MSVIVKGMKMPKNCYDCDFTFSKGTEHGNFTDPLSGKVFHERERFGCLLCEMDITFVESIEYGRYKDCPLVEVPTPHGRLGDLDKLEQMFVDIDNAPYSCFDGEEPFYSAEDAAQIIRLAPTIIESEEMNG